MGKINNHKARVRAQNAEALITLSFQRHVSRPVTPVGCAMPHLGATPRVGPIGSMACYLSKPYVYVCGPSYLIWSRTLSFIRCAPMHVTYGEGRRWCSLRAAEPPTVAIANRALRHAYEKVGAASERAVRGEGDLRGYNKT